MKWTIIFAFTLVPIISIAQNKKFDKLIETYDVRSYVENVPKGNTALFWDAVWRNNERLTKLFEACKKGKSSAEEAQKSVSNSLIVSQVSRNTLPIMDSLQFAADTLLHRIGIKELFSDAYMKIVDNSEKNAYTYPDGAIYLNAPLIYDFEYEQTLGICAHEAAHFILQHTLQEAFATQKRLRKNKIIAGIAASVNIAANAYAQANGASTSDSWEYVNKMTESLFDEAEMKANKYRYKYSREEEIEADLIAYRFLEYFGCSGINYIMALKNLGYDNDNYYNDESTHPTIKFRVDLLEYIFNKEQKH